MTERKIPRLTAEHREAFTSAIEQLQTQGHKGGPVRYRPHGRSVGGIDCIGVVVWGLNRIGIEVEEDRSDYALRPDGKTLRETMVRNLGQPIDKVFARVGDVVLMRWHENKATGIKYFNHVGVLMPLPYKPEQGLRDPLAKFSLTHAFIGSKTVVRHEVSSPWDRRILEVYSLTGRSA